MEKNKTIPEMIDEFIELFTTITKEECDYIETVLKWHEEKQMAFFMAKRIFEERTYDRKRKTKT